MTSTDRYDYAFDPDGDAWAARLLRQVPPGSTVLELGPGPGAMTKVLRGRGHTVTAVENDPDAVVAVRALGAEVIAADLDDPNWNQALADRRFDVVLACDVLEHLNDPEPVLYAASRVVASQGRLVASIPNVAYAGVVAALRQGLFDYADKGILDRTHKRFFTRRSVEKAMQEQGWAPLRWDVNRVPIEDSEFHGSWRSLTEVQRQGLLSGWSDFDVYQWMVVATPLAEGVSWELVQARSDAAAAREELHVLQMRHSKELDSLLEHQRAFAEAKELIAKSQAELDRVNEALAQSVAATTELERQVAALNQQSRFGRWWRRQFGSQ